MSTARAKCVCEAWAHVFFMPRTQTPTVGSTAAEWRQVNRFLTLGALELAADFEMGCRELTPALEQSSDFVNTGQYRNWPGSHQANDIEILATIL